MFSFFVQFSLVTLIRKNYYLNIRGCLISQYNIVWYLVIVVLHLFIVEKYKFSLIL